MEVVVTAGAIRLAKLQSNRHRQQTNTEFFLQAGCPSCRPTNSVKALKGNWGFVIVELIQVKFDIFDYPVLRAIYGGCNKVGWGAGVG